MFQTITSPSHKGDSKETLRDLILLFLMEGKRSICWVSPRIDYRRGTALVNLGCLHCKCQALPLAPKQRGFLCHPGGWCLSYWILCTLGWRFFCPINLVRLPPAARFFDAFATPLVAMIHLGSGGLRRPSHLSERRPPRPASLPILRWCPGFLRPRFSPPPSDVSPHNALVR